MSKRSEHIKIDRRLGCNLWGRPKSPFNKENMGQGARAKTRKDF